MPCSPWSAQNPRTAVSSGVLADNGGAVETILIQRGGAAQNAGDNSLLSEATAGVDLNGDGDTLDTITTDARGDARIANGTVDIGAVELQNAAPVAENDAFATDQNTSVTGDVTADNGNGVDSDPDGDPLTVTMVDGATFTPGAAFGLPSGALLTMNHDGTFVWNPNGAFDSLAGGAVGHDSFTYSVVDPDGTAGTATVAIDVTGLNENPVARDDGFATDEATSVTGDVTADNGHGADSDTNGDTLTVTGVNGATFTPGVAVALASGALLTMNGDGTFTYDPNHVFDHLPVGVVDHDSFTYTVEDGHGGSDMATVAIDITGLDTEISSSARRDLIPSRAASATTRCLASAARTR